jgi:hypothetical protein
LTAKSVIEISIAVVWFAASDAPATGAHSVAAEIMIRATSGAPRIGAYWVPTIQIGLAAASARLRIAQSERDAGAAVEAIKRLSEAPPSAQKRKPALPPPSTNCVHAARPAIPDPASRVRVTALSVPPPDPRGSDEVSAVCVPVKPVCV